MTRHRRADTPGDPDRESPGAESAVSPTRLGWRQACGLYVGFFLGVVAVTWPLVTSPATLWPLHHDARVFTWVMASVARRLVTDPLVLFHGNAFYPYGLSLVYTEPLIPPAIVGLPGFLWGNPILTYNLLLLALWPLNGVAMAWVARALTGSRSAGWLAGAVFCLSPYFTEYYLEFQMLLAALLPAVMFAWVRWLETRQPRWLVGALAGLTLQGLTTWYYTVILGLGLVTLTAGFLCLRWRRWRWRDAAAVALGALGVGAILLPVALPYLVVHRELGFERGIGETAGHSADLFTFVEPGRRSLLYRFAPSGHIAETSAFTGFGVLALAAASLAWFAREPPASAAVVRLGWTRWIPAVASLLAVGWTIVFRPTPYRLGPLSIDVQPAYLLELAVLLGLGLLLARGWATRGPGQLRGLSEADWVRLLLLLTGIFAILALGPVIHVARREVGPGPYLALYQVLLPLHVVRVTTRFAVLSVAGLALLAALGLRAAEDRLRRRPRLRRAFLVGVFVGVGLEYSVTPAQYKPVNATPRLVDVAVRADPNDVALLELPIDIQMSDADAMVRSLGHGKHVVNGLSGFVPGGVRRLGWLLLRPGSPYPVPEAQTALRRIYPLRYLVVRLGDPALPREWHLLWRALPRDPPPLLRFRGSFGEEDLYEVVPLPERGARLQRWVSYDFLRRHRVLHVGLRPLSTDPGVGQWVDVLLNGRRVHRIPMSRDAAMASIALSPPFLAAAPNVITLRYGDDRPSGAREGSYQIGTTGVVSPGDLRVTSGGRAHGNVGSVEFKGLEVSPNRRGYNLVALDRGGRLLGAENFDTFSRREASRELAAWVASLPTGTIIAGAVRDEGSRQLREEVIRALRTLGVTGDLRRRFRQSHAFIGVKGAPPGSALEAIGSRLLELRVGPGEEWEADIRNGFELTDFALTPATARPKDR